MKNCFLFILMKVKIIDDSQAITPYQADLNSVINLLYKSSFGNWEILFFLYSREREKEKRENYLFIVVKCDSPN